MSKLIIDIRKIVFSSTEFDRPHQVRLLNRISQMESEIYKERGKFDVFLGALVDFGEAAGKFGADIKPLTDRITEVVGIARRNTDAYNQLPAPDEIKKIAPPVDEDDGAA